jgi:hypothetical protein
MDSIAARDVEIAELRKLASDEKRMIARLKSQRDGAYSLAETSPRNDSELQFAIIGGVAGLAIGIMGTLLLVRR